MPFLHSCAQKSVISKKISPCPYPFIISTFTFYFTYY